VVPVTTCLHRGVAAVAVVEDTVVAGVLWDQQRSWGKEGHGLRFGTAC